MKPVYVISASVPSGNRLKRFYGDGPDNARTLISTGKQFRHGGFDLTVGSVPEAGKDGAWELANGDRKVLRLYQDGTFVFRMAADQEFLGWGVEPEAFLHLPRLNPVAVVEVHASFVVSYARIISRLSQVPEAVKFDLTLRNVAVSDKRLLMTKYFSGLPWSAIDLPSYVVQTDPATESKTLSSDKVINQPLAVAYDLVELFASMFDMPPELIPFVKTTDSQREIDIDALRRLS